MFSTVRALQRRGLGPFHLTFKALPGRLSPFLSKQRPEGEKEIPFQKYKPQNHCSGGGPWRTPTYRRSARRVPAAARRPHLRARVTRSGGVPAPQPRSLGALSPPAPRPAPGRTALYLTVNSCNLSLPLPPPPAFFFFPHLPRSPSTSCCVLAQ